jgi:hypothetical protein
MAKMGSEGISQLRRASVHCPIHGNFKVPMLPPISCPGCESERGHSDLLRRSVREKRRWKHKQHDNGGSVEENGMDSSTASGGSV